ncbi:MAG: segregation/condensation protein A [Candidatus Woesearchaeota archaeon]
MEEKSEKDEKASQIASEIFKKDQKHPNDQVMSILLDSEDITWQSILYELINTNQMDPWDIDISLIASKFIEVVKAMKKMDLRVPAKMILASAMLLKIKSRRLVGEDLDALDQLFASTDEEDDIQGLFDEEVDKKIRDLEIPGLIPRSPQMRKRKVSIYDLVYALDKALEVKKRRVFSRMPDIDLEIPAKSVDITALIKNIYFKIKNFFSNKSDGNLTFSQLLPSMSREDKVYTFIPLLHLTNQRKIDLEQEEAFGEIRILMNTQQELEKEIDESKEQIKSDKDT